MSTNAFQTSSKKTTRKVVTYTTFFSEWNRAENLTRKALLKQFGALAGSRFGRAHV